MKIGLLRNLMLLDAVVLFLLGASWVFIPGQVQRLFAFNALPTGVNYMLGLWGCVFISLAIGYFFAAAEPLRHLLWVRVGIARGALETGLGLYYLARGLVSFPQAGVGIILAALITLAYLACYPRGPRQSV